MRTFITILVIILIIVAVIIFTRSGNEAQKTVDLSDVETGILASETEGTGIEKGDQIPDFQLLNFNNNPVKLSDFQGKPVVVNFWAGWCPFCIDEMPAFENSFNEYKDDVGLVILGIHRTETESKSRGQKFADDFNITYLLLQDTRGEVYREYSGGQSFMPVTYFIDKNGTIKKRVLGPMSEDQIKDNIGLIVQ